MDFKYIKNQSEDSADIYLYAPIGNGGINAQQFVNELRFLDGLGLKSINVRINSGGGSVIDGFGIFSAIRAAQTPVNTIIDGIAASIAGIIAMAGKNRSIADFGRLMVHDPSFGNKAKVSKKDKEVLDSIKTSLITILSNNSSLDMGEIFNLMSEETWFNAEEALAFGFVDEVFSTNRKVEKDLAVDEIMNIANDLIIIKKDNMVNVFKHLGLSDSAEEIEVLNSVKAIEVKVTEKATELENLTATHTTEVDTLNNTIAEKETAIVELTKSIATLTVENAIKDGKFKESDKETLIEKAVNDLEGFNLIANAVTIAPASITAAINQEKKEVKKVTFSEMSKNDEAGLMNLLNNDFAAYSELYKNEFGVEPTR